MSKILDIVSAADMYDFSKISKTEQTVTCASIFPPNFFLLSLSAFQSDIWISHEVVSSLNMSTYSSVLYWHVLFHRVSLSTCLNMLVPARQIPQHLQDPSRCVCINIPWENYPIFLSCLENTETPCRKLIRNAEQLDPHKNFSCYFTGLPHCGWVQVGSLWWSGIPEEEKVCCDQNWEPTWTHQHH